MAMWCRMARLTIPCLSNTEKLQRPRNCSRISAAFFCLIRHRESLAPAVLADLAFDHLAGVRRLEQRAQFAAINVLWRVLILRLLPRHFFRRLRPGNPQQEPCGNSLDDRTYDLAPRLIHAFFNHEIPCRLSS